MVKPSTVQHRRWRRTNNSFATNKHKQWTLSMIYNNLINCKPPSSSSFVRKLEYFLFVGIICAFAAPISSCQIKTRKPIPICHSNALNYKHFFLFTKCFRIIIAEPSSMYVVRPSVIECLLIIIIYGKSKYA